jgi:hypothetical protein
MNVMLPPAMLDGMVSFFNQRLKGGGSDPKTTRGEMVKFYGFMGALTIFDTWPVKHMWRVEAAPKEIMSPPAMGRHGLSKTRFERLRHLAGELWDTGVEHDRHVLVNAPWTYTGFLEEAFNAHMPTAVQPGTELTVDEGMCHGVFTSMEKIEDVKRKAEDIPFLANVPRKPRPLGCEFKGLLDVDVGVMLRIERQVGAKFNTNLKYHAGWGHSPSQLLRLTEPWHHMNKILTGDSWFISLKAMEALLSMVTRLALAPPRACAHPRLLVCQGVYAGGDVKTNSDRYPKKEIGAELGSEPGDWATMTSTMADFRANARPDGTVPIFALAHRRGGAVRLAPRPPPSFFFLFFSVHTPVHTRVHTPRRSTGTCPRTARPSWARRRRTTSPASARRASAPPSSTRSRGRSLITTSTTTGGSASWAWRRASLLLASRSASSPPSWA